jgi:hypothetical protein
LKRTKAGFSTVPFDEIDGFAEIGFQRRDPDARIFQRNVGVMQAEPTAID